MASAAHGTRAEVALLNHDAADGLRPVEGALPVAHARLKVSAIDGALVPAPVENELFGSGRRERMERMQGALLPCCLFGWQGAT